MTKKRINSKWYSYERKPYDYMQEGRTSPEGYLYAQGQYPTLIRAEDLPPSFIYGRFYKRWGYLDTAGVVDMLYIPNLWINHFLKDDRLVVSFSGKIKKKKRDEWGDEYENEDYSIWGNEIIDFLKGAREYSDFNIKPFIKQIKEKLVILKERHPEEFGDYNPDIDKYFSEPISNYDSFLKRRLNG